MRTQELTELTKNPLPGIQVSASESNVYSWTVIIDGPPESVYEGGRFRLQVDFPVEYPFKGPKAQFRTKIYHPNIDNDGNLCIGLLKSEAWKPSTKADTSECPPKFRPLTWSHTHTLPVTRTTPSPHFHLAIASRAQP